MLYSINLSGPVAAGVEDSTANYGQRLLDTMREMFSVFHNAENLTATDFVEAMEKSRKAFGCAPRYSLKDGLKEYLGELAKSTCLNQ